MFGAFVLFRTHHFLDLSGHCSDVRMDHLVNIAIRVFASYAQTSSKRKLVLLVEFQDI